MSQPNTRPTARLLVLQLLPATAPGVRAHELQDRLEAYARGTVRKACRQLARDGLVGFHGRHNQRRYYRIQKT